MNSITENTLTRSLKMSLIVGTGVLFVAGVFVGVMLARYHYNTIIQTHQATYARQLKALSDEASVATRHALAQTVAALNEKQQLDDYYHKELENAQHSAQTLRDDVLRGRRRLQLARADLATCQITANDATRSRALGDGAEIQFSVEAGLLVDDIRTDIKRDHAKLDYLQAYVKKVVHYCQLEKQP